MTQGGEKIFGGLPSYGVDGYPLQPGFKPLPPEEMLTQECIDKMDLVKPACSPSFKGERPPPAECNQSVKEAYECLNSLRLECTGGGIWDAKIFWAFRSHHVTLQMMALPFDLKAVLNDVFLASAAHCEAALIEDVLEFITKAVSAKGLQDLMSFIRKTKESQLPLPEGMTLSHKGASLLLIKFFERRFPGRQMSEYLKMAAHFFPLVPKKR